jgi:hypothetical protein
MKHRSESKNVMGRLRTGGKRKRREIKSGDDSVSPGNLRKILSGELERRPSRLLRSGNPIGKNSSNQVDRGVSKNDE